MGLYSQKYNKLVIVDLHYLMTSIIIIIIIIINSFLYAFLIFAVNKSNKVIHSKEINIIFKMTVFCNEKETNIFHFPNE